MSEIAAPANGQAQPPGFIHAPRPAPTGPVVTLDAVTVEYGKNRALRDVTAHFPAGAIGLLGPNGAGKSTMLKALLGFVKPTSGQMKVLDLNVADKPYEIRARLGYMPGMWPSLSGM